MKAHPRIDQRESKLTVRSVDMFGKVKPDYKDYGPVNLKCYNIKNDTVSIYHERGYMSQMWCTSSLFTTVTEGIS